MENLHLHRNLDSKKKKKKRIYNKCIERNIRLNIDLATSIFFFPSQQGTQKKERNITNKIKRDTK